MKTNNKGFSLVELIVVIAIMAILAAIAIPTFATFITKANVASDESFLNDLEYAAQLAHTTTGDKVKGVTVAVDAQGNVVSVTYKLTDADKDNEEICTITIAKVSDEWKATAKVGEDTTKYAALAKDAETAIGTIDWEYKFKSEKKEGTWARKVESNVEGDWEFKAPTT